MNTKYNGFRLDYWLTAFLLAAMALIAFVNILSRYIFHFSFAATEELTINFFVWMTVLGSGIAFEHGAQMGMVTFFRRFPPRLRRGSVLLGAFLSAGLFIVVNIYMIQAIRDEITLFQAKSAALGIPVWIYYSGVPLLSIFVLRGIYRDTLNRLERIDPNEAA
jgi:TRAP-type C4-dicarboxylate transport system permease small subunit